MRAYCYGLCALCAACSVHFGECALCSEQCALWRMCATARAAQCSVRWHPPSGQLLPTLTLQRLFSTVTLQRRVTASSCNLEKCDFEWSVSSQLCDMFPVIQVNLKVFSGRSVVSQLDESGQSGESRLRLQIILFLLAVFQFERLTALVAKVSRNKNRAWCHWSWQSKHVTGKCQIIPALSWSYWVLHMSCHWMCWSIYLYYGVQW